MANATGESSHNQAPWRVRDYVRALRDLGQQLEPEALRLLSLQLQAPDQRISAAELAAQTSCPVVQINRIYGRAGKALGSCLTGQLPESLEKGWPFLSHGEYQNGVFFWTLHQPLQKALAVLELASFTDETQAYTAALLHMQDRRALTPSRLKLLQEHYSAPHQDVTAGELSVRMGWGNFSSANVHYGRLGAHFSDFLGPCPSQYEDGTPMTVGHLVTFWHDGELWHWVMRRGLRRALENLNLVDPLPVVQSQDTDENDISEMRLGGLYREGAVRTVQVNAYERDRAARQACIQRHGITCQVCYVDLSQVYGPVAEGFIHVHHLRPLSEIGEEYTVNPESDLLPVCPNCHAMLHRRLPPYTVPELQAMMRQAHQNAEGGSDLRKPLL